MSRVLDVAHKVGSVALVSLSFGSLVWFGFQMRDFIQHAKAAYTPEAIAARAAAAPPKQPLS
jgi:hypothetical protein